MYLYIEQSGTPSPSSAAVDLGVMWVDARKNKQVVIDNEKVQEVVNRVVNLKEKESFRTVDSQVILEKPLGLRQYPGRIRGAGFGASKQFLAHSAKRLTKADGIINNCKLFLDTPCARAVGIGSMYNTQDAMIHNVQIPSNHLKVSIDISIEYDALMPIPVDEDIITVRLALGTFVAWPKHLIDVVPIMGKVYADHSATSPPRIDEPASKKAKVVKSEPQSSKSNLESSGPP
ncbi:hypothetical protein Lal_00010809 [Lupinus albus]|nr:hypothetical protein Lal_00010809 [Lupinus albus]